MPISRPLPVEVTHTSLDLFSRQSMLVNLQHAIEVRIGPASEPNGRTLDFKILGERTNFIDLNHIYLALQVQLRKSDGNPLKEDASDATSLADPDKTDKPTVVNNLLHSLFEDYELRANDERISSANGRYAHKAFLETEMSSTEDEKNSWLISQGYQYESNPADLTTGVFRNRRALATPTSSIYLYGKLSCDVFTTSPFLVPGVTLSLKLLRSSHDFTTITDQAAKHYQIAILDANLIVRKVLVKDDIAAAIERRLLKEPAVYQYTEVIPKAYLMSPGSTFWKQDDIFQKEPIRRIALAMCLNTHFDGSHDTNPFQYNKFDLREVVLKRNGTDVPGSPLYTVDDNMAYYNSLRALAFNRNSHGISVADYPNHYVIVFDLTSTLEASHMLINPETTNGSLYLELKFGTPLPHNIALFLIGERTSVLYIDGNKKVSKNTLFDG